MTVLIGRRCSDGAVLACDSQETRANYFRFWPKARLIGTRFVALYAGNPTIGEAFVRNVGTAFGDEDVSRVTAVHLIEASLVSLVEAAGEDAKGRQILIGGVTRAGELCLWAVDQGEIYLREMRTWECYGSGIDAAEMLMGDFHFPEVSTREAVPLLAYVINAVGEICLDCGGPISVVVVRKDGIELLEPGDVQAQLDNVKPLLDRLRKELPTEVLKGALTAENITRLLGRSQMAKEA